MKTRVRRSRYVQIVLGILFVLGSIVPYSVSLAAPAVSGPDISPQTAVVAPTGGDTVAVAQNDEINYCDYAQKTGPGDVASWLASAPVGANTDCIDIWIESQGCGYLDIRIDDKVLNLTPNVLRWTEGQTDIWSQRQSSFPITFPEDYNGGSVWVTVVLVAAEKDYVDFAGEDALTYWSGNAVDQSFLIQTDCEQPEPVNYCTDYTSGEGAVWQFLDRGIAEGANTDCIDVGIEVLECGSLSIPITDNVGPFDYWIEWVEGTDITSGTPSTANPITFPEGYNGGSVTITAYIGGPEQDFVTYANEGNYAYAMGGVTFTIDTNCAAPEPTATATPGGTTPEPTATPDGTTHKPTATPDGTAPKPTKPAAADKDKADETAEVTTLPSTGAGNGPDAGMWVGLATLLSASLLVTAFGTRKVTGRR